MPREPMDTSESAVLNDLIRNALAEDIGQGDITAQSTVPGDLAGHARIIARENGVVAGTPVAERIARQLDPQLEIRLDFTDGRRIRASETLLSLSGAARSILQAERVTLNFLGHLSGVATMTSQFVSRIDGTGAKITDTRKTTPLMRRLEKAAVLAGGGVNHRMGLDDMILIKENHIRAAGGIREAVNAARRFLRDNGLDVQVEVETRNLEEVRTAMTVDIDRLMLDNMTIPEIKEAVELINHQVEVEASGGVTLENVRDIALCGVDFISVGALTHSVKALDYSLLFD